MRAGAFDDRRGWWLGVLGACLAGFALRLATAASGALWTDEAWSVVYAAEARDAAGVFLRINHDNNHHLYSLWLQAIGSGASPLLARLPAIIAGTLCVPVAALIVGRRSRTAGLVAAVLFAVSPALVTFGSEARGYAPMLLAALVVLLLAGDAVERGAKPATPWLIALAALVGMLFHLTMAAPVALVALWVYLDRRAALGPSQALGTAARLMGPALGATGAVVALVFAAAAASPTGIRLGGYVAFAWRDYWTALDDLAAWTAGISLPLAWLGPLAIALVALWIAVRPPPWLGARARLYAILILAVPLAAALLEPGNAGFARYYLASALGLLLLLAEWLGQAIGQGGRTRVLALAALVVVTGAALWRDAELVTLGRGRLEVAVAFMTARPGASVALAPARLEAALTLAAARRGARLSIARGCAPADFLLAGHGRFDRPRALLGHCGRLYRAIAAGRTTPLSGDAWTLYAATGLQTSQPPVSGRASPAAASPPHPVRAGVAQG